MRRQTEFYEVETRKNKLDIIIVTVAIVTLLLTGALFASKANGEVTATTGTELASAYETE